MNQTASPTDVDWPAFIGQHDMRLTELPDRWQAAPHFGNAMVGSMLLRVGNTIRLQVHRQDVHDHRDDGYGWTAYSRPRLLIGYFSLTPVGQLTGCAWRKDLWNAELNGTVQTDRGMVRIRHFVHADDMAIVTELTPDAGEAGCTWTWHAAPAETTRPGYPRDAGYHPTLGAYARRYGERHRETLQPWSGNPAGRLERRGDVSLWVQDLLAGGQYATAWAETEAGDTRTFWVTIANSYPDATAADTAAVDIERFVGVDRDAWLDMHRAWWHGYYPRSFVTLADKRIEALYWQTVYRYGCTSRTGRWHVDTSGMWFQGRNWPYTTNDWNTQAAHWGVYAANRLEQGREIVDRLHRYRHNLIEAVHPYEWRDDCAYLNLATAGDMAGNRTGDMRYYDFVGGLPWLLHNGWWQYRFSMDDAMLREKVYPLLRRAVNLYLRLIEEDGDGRLHLPRTYSPETGSYRDANFDLALLKWSCHTLRRTCKRLDIDDPLSPRWQDVIDRLADFPVDERGFMLAGDQTAPAYHRHLSHLLMIYPLYLVNIDQPEQRDVLMRSYEHVHRGRVADGDESHPLQAMVQTHAAPIGCALGLGDQALEGLKRLIDELGPAGHWPPHEDNPCIESTLSLMNIVQDMLIQSWSDPAAETPGPIRVFPAMPSEWADVAYHNLRAEGAFLVSARRRGGRTEWVRIESLAGEPCSVKLDGDDKLRVEGIEAAAVDRTAPGVYKIKLSAGQTVDLFPLSQPDQPDHADQLDQ